MVISEISTQVTIVGGGPAGLLLSQLLALSGVDSIVLERRGHDAIANTHRAGILEEGSVKLLAEAGLEEDVKTKGDRHEGIDIRTNGVSHRLDFPELVGSSVWLYPQNEVFVDLAAVREKQQGDVRFGHEVVSIDEIDSDSPVVTVRDPEGNKYIIRSRFVVGADGSRSTARSVVGQNGRFAVGVDGARSTARSVVGVSGRSIAGTASGSVAVKTGRKDFFIEYPFAWFGILVEAPRSADELIYSRSDRGFALISQRNTEVQRMYFQVDTGTDVKEWSDDRIWEELQARVAGADGFQLQTGRIFEKTVLPFRSFVSRPLRSGSLFLAGDAGHTVPPTGAKGLNLAIRDVKLLFEALESYFSSGSEEHIDAYSDLALSRVWRAQHFSYWLTTLLHHRKDAHEFDEHRIEAELASLLASRYGKQLIAEGYTGWPQDLSR